MINDDWYDLLVALIGADATFLVVGAHALAVHGVPRGTQDIDIWIDASTVNARRVQTALEQFGAPLDALRLSIDDFQRPDTVIQIGMPPNRVDLLTSLTGLESFEAAWNERVEHRIRELIVPFIGRASLVRNKRATGRLKDLADVEELERLD